MCFAHRKTQNERDQQHKHEDQATNECIASVYWMAWKRVNVMLRMNSATVYNPKTNTKLPIQFTWVRVNTAQNMIREIHRESWTPAIRHRNSEESLWDQHKIYLIVRKHARQNISNDKHIHWFMGLITVFIIAFPRSKSIWLQFCGPHTRNSANLHNGMSISIHALA